MNVAINGYGRIGQLVLRALHERESIQTVKAIVDLTDDVEELAYRTKYDSVHGRFPGEVSTYTELTTNKSYLIVDGHTIRCLKAPNSLTELPWRDLNIDCVVEATGVYNSLEAYKHCHAGARCVIITAPAKDDIQHIVYGVNDGDINFYSAHGLLISAASCTTNCLAPLISVLLRSGIGFERGLMTTIHAYTATQKIVDSPSSKNWRDGRAAALNIIPSSTGAAKAVAKVLPQVEGRLTGMAFRVPTADVSVVDLTFQSRRRTSIKTIDMLMKEASETYLKGILEYANDQCVSSDFLHSTASSIYDSTTTLQNNFNGDTHFFKLVAWYDNEFGYSNRIVDLLTYIKSFRGNDGG